MKILKLEILNLASLDNPEGEVHYQCDCNRERTERVLKALGNQELTQLIAEGEPVEVNCHFCGKKYTFTPEELQQLRDEEPEE